MRALLLFIVLGISLYAASTTYMYLRCSRREPFLRHLTRRSTLLAPYSAFIYLFSSLPDRPVHSAAVFPELEALQSEWRTIREEAVALLKQGHIGVPHWSNDPAIEAFYSRGWTRFYLKWYGDFLPSARLTCPRTVEVLASVPAVRGAMFAFLPRGGRLEAHTDPFAGGLRYHLGLLTPNSPLCRILVDATPYFWRDGEPLVFDETYLHEVANETDQDRLILFCDVERPMRQRWARSVNRSIRQALMRATAIQNEDSDPVGSLARLLGKANSMARRLLQHMPAA